MQRTKIKIGERYAFRRYKYLDAGKVEAISYPSKSYPYLTRVRLVRDGERAREFEATPRQLLAQWDAYTTDRAAKNEAADREMKARDRRYAMHRQVEAQTPAGQLSGLLGAAEGWSPGDIVISVEDAPELLALLRELLEHYQGEPA